MALVSNIIISVGAILLLLSGVYATLYNNSAAVGGVLLGFGFLFVVLLLLSKFKRFKGFGFEAEMWEEKQEEAVALVASLKRMQIAYSKAIFGIVADPDVGHGRQNMFERRDAIKNFVIYEAEYSGLTQSQIREILDVEKDSVSSEYAAAVYHCACKAARNSGTDTQPLEGALRRIIDTHPSPDELEKVLNDYRMNDPETREFIHDYRHYCATGRHRRPEIWANRGQWMARYLGFDKGWW